MASESKSNPPEEEAQQHDHDAAAPAPSHHPSAPSDELFDISTTVDPSYVISLIRKLIPTDARSDPAEPRGGDASSDVRVNKSNAAADYMEECGNGNGNSLSRGEVENGVQELSPADDSDKSTCRNGEGEELSSRLERHGNLAGEDAWEEYGCILWDLAASRTHAELMVDNLILEVLLTHLMVSKSVRITEICLGIIGNLACHEVLMERIVSANGLIELVIEQLSLDDTQCLCEACRLLTLGLQGDKCRTWAEALQSEHILGRIIWIAENTLNPQLLEKCVGLLLAIIDGQQGVSAVLLPSLMRLGLTSLLISLLTFEISSLTGERASERYCVLDVILRAIESLSTLDGHSQEICCNRELFQLVCNLVKLPDKAEVASSCATAAVLIANILSDVPDLAFEVSNDSTFLQGLLDIFPLASDDFEVRSAIWSIIARLMVRVKESEMELSSLHQYVLVLASKADLIEDDLLDQQFDNPNEESRSSISSNAKSNARNTALQRIVSILNQWTAPKDCNVKDDEMEEHYDIGVNVGKLLDCCHKYIK